MKNTIDGKALVYADGAFNTPNGKTAHGLVRFTERYEVVGVIDHTYKGQDAGMVLDNRSNLTTELSAIKSMAVISGILRSNLRLSNNRAIRKGRR